MLQKLQAQPLRCLDLPAQTSQKSIAWECLARHCSLCFTGSSRDHVPKSSEQSTFHCNIAVLLWLRANDMVQDGPSDAAVAVPKSKKQRTLQAVSAAAADETPVINIRSAKAPPTPAPPSQHAAIG